MSALKETQTNIVDQVLLQQLNTVYAFSFLLCHDTKLASTLTKDAIIEARRTHDRRDAGLGLEHHTLQQLWDRYQPSTASSWTPAAAPIELTILGTNKFEVAFHEAISELKREAGIVIFLCDGASLTPLEAGLVLKLPISTIRSRLYRARATLRKKLNSFETDQSSVEAQTLANPVKFKDSLRFIMQQHRVEVPVKLRQDIEQILLPPARKDPRATTFENKTETVLENWQWPLSILLVLSLSAMAYFLAPSTVPPAPLGNDLITRSAAASSRVKMVLPTDNTPRIQEFIQTHYRINTIPPIIKDAELVGLGSVEIMPEVVIPAFIYNEHDNERLVIIIYNYRMLDRYRNFVSLDAGLQMRLIDDHHYEMIASGYENYYVLTWRRRATLFVAVTNKMPETLLDRIEE